MHPQLTKYFSILIAATSGMAMNGCIYDDLKPCLGENVDITIVNDWELAPDADPEGIAYTFYIDGVKDHWRFDFPGREAGKVILPTGDYRFLMYNDDTSGVRFESGDDGTMVATSRPGHILEGLPGWNSNDTITYTREKVLICPDMMWSGSYSDVTVTYDQLTYSDSTATYTSRLSESNPMQLVTKPRQIVATYSYDIINVENLSGVKRMCAAMSGLAASLCVNNGLPSSQPVTLPVKAVKSSDSSIFGKFFTFGLPRAARAPNLLYLFVWLTDGRQYVYEFDVTEQVVKAPDHLNVHVVVDSLSLPESIPGESVGTFDPSVDGWTHVVVNFVV